MRYDHHVHSTYSDGRFLYSMLSAAEEAGLEGVGIADHCNVSDRDRMRELKHMLGFNLDRTYERRRDAIERYRDRFDLDIFDAVEMDYDPRDEPAIRSFLEEAGFDYAIGSVHYLDGVNVHVESYFEGKPEAERAALVDEYFDRVIRLVESGLFDIAAHVDLVERTRPLRGLASEAHYEAVAGAFEESRTVPEINAGRALSEYGELHPTPAFLEVLRDRGIEVVASTDAHTPAELRDRVDHIRDALDERGLDAGRVA